MKLKKVFAGMAASAIAMSVCAMTSATSASALETAGTAGITFQTADTWNFRDLMGTEGSTPAFPSALVGVQGGAYGNGSVECSDTSIQYDGTYTVSIATSGKIVEANTDKESNKAGFYIDEDQTLTRKDCPWSMLCNYEPAASESSSLSQDEIVWEEGSSKTTKFNMLCIDTDIPVTYNDDNQPEINGTVVEVSDIVVDMCGTKYEATGETFYKTDNKASTLAVSIINAYGDSTIDPAAMPTQDGTISVTFTIKGLGEAPSSSTSESGTDSTASSTTSTTSSAASSSKSSGTSSTAKASSTSTTTSSAAESDNTNNADSGAPAGIALALAAVAGAAIVVSRKK